MSAIKLDHIIFAAPDLQGGIDAIKALTGVEPEFSGSHPGRGTRNALFALGTNAYIEILAPDPAQPASALASAASRIPEVARITTWAACTEDLEAAVGAARAGGVELGSIQPGSRALPKGGELNWRSARGDLPGDGLVPFLLEWGAARHPSHSVPAGCALRYFRAEHPDSDQVRAQLEVLGAQDLLEVTRGTQPRFFLGLSSPNGDVELN